MPPHDQPAIEAPRPVSPEIPYVGMRPYTELEKDLFFGREREARLLINKILSGPLTVLHAPSGAGKTSLLHARVIPSLRSQETLVCYFDRWVDADPARALRAAVLEVLSGSGGPSLSNDSTIRDAIEAVIGERDRTFVLILDQFEEFLVCKANYVQQLSEQIGTLVRSEWDVHVVLSLREEFLAGLNALRNEVLTVFQSRFRLEYLSGEDAREAIVRPAERLHTTYDADLIDVLIRELRVEAGNNEAPSTAACADGIELPFLQLVCLNLWVEGRRRRSSHLTLDLYRSLGSRNGIVERYVSGVTLGLSGSDRLVTARILTFLAPPSGMKISYSVADLANHTGIAPAEVEKSVRHLCGPRILRTRETSSGTRYELYHDAFTQVLGPWAQSLMQRRRRRRQTVAVLGATSCVLAIIVAFVVYRAKVETRNYRQFLEMESAFRNERLENEARLEQERLRSEAVQEKARLERENETKLRDLQEIVTSLTTFKQLDKSLADGLAGPHIESQVDALVRSLFNKGKAEKGHFDQLCQELQRPRLKEYLQTHYGRPPDVRSAMEQIPWDADWPITVTYSSALAMDEGQLQYQWRVIAVRNLAEQWGIPVPRALKVRRYPGADSNTLKVSILDTLDSPSDTPRQRATDKEGFSMTVDLPPLADGILVESGGISEHSNPSVRELMESLLDKSAPVPQLKRGGPWWIAPAWTFPLWRMSRLTAYPKEAAVALILGNRMIDEPRTLLTRSSIRLLLDRLKGTYPITVEEAVTARGGQEGVAAVLIEIMRNHEGALTHLPYYLEALANQHPKEPEQAARTVWSEAFSNNLSRRIELTGPRPRIASVDALRHPTFAEAHRESMRWIQSWEKSVQVFPGIDLGKEWISDRLLKPEVLNTLESLSRELYLQFGIVIPRPIIYQADPHDRTREPDEFSIRVLKQPESDLDCQPMRAGPKPLETLHQELKWRLLNTRVHWVTSDYVEAECDRLPPELEVWLRRRFSLADLKLILRGVIEPGDAELDANGRGPITKWPVIPPEHTIRDLDWLLSSLVFWCALENLQDRDHVVRLLRETQRAGKHRVRDAAPPESPVLSSVREGIEFLKRGALGEAEKKFKESKSRKLEDAKLAFLALFPEERFDSLLKRAALPPPGRLREHVGDYRVTWEVEDALKEPSLERLPEVRRALELYLVWNGNAGEDSQFSKDLVSKLAAQGSFASWTSEQAYLLGYVMLKTASPSYLPPLNLRAIEDLLIRALEGMKTTAALDEAYEKLINLSNTTITPAWFVSLMERLQEKHPKSHGAAYQLGHVMAFRSGKDAAKALRLLSLAKDNLENTPEIKDIDAKRAWLDLSRTYAMGTLHDALIGEDHAESRETAEYMLSLANDLDLRIPKERDAATQWPDRPVILERRLSALQKTGDLLGAMALADQVLKGEFKRDFNLLAEGIFIALRALDLAKAERWVDAWIGMDPEGEWPLFYASIIRLAGGHKDYEAISRKYLKTRHLNDHWIRQLLFWRLNKEGRSADASRVLNEEAPALNPRKLEWEGRLAGGDYQVWAEMMLCMVQGRIPRAAVFDPLKSEEGFRESSLSGLTKPRLALLCDATFYEALAEDARDPGPPSKQKERWNAVVALKRQNSFEFHIARYLLKQLNARNDK